MQEELGNGLPAYMAAATDDQLSATSTKAWETQEERCIGFAGYKQQQRLRMCQCGECKTCRSRDRVTKSRAKKAAAKKAAAKEAAAKKAAAPKKAAAKKA
ncbi:hypothetical protein HYH03_009920 [Edaphochlamys debaryana]|uniref:Uncharacterized protein n=1 Tax=Edaphochlamys debaryana TaxID=47281 RepID=A0A835XXS6_9CHLO|nr:hypothetical protein HYH03_009920 [Edaphochlamys debaryana]|eukprot:KAG2491759.1 hypothetical protein HYH03_009920 [Edaphochlamys debaryana]